MSIEPVNGQPGRSQRDLVIRGVVGVAAQIAFMAGWLVAETWQGPRYNPIRYTISDLRAATAPQVWFPIACFAIGGIGTFAFAVFGLRPALTAAGKVAAYAPWCVAWIFVLAVNLVLVSRRVDALLVKGER